MSCGIQIVVTIFMGEVVTFKKGEGVYSRSLSALIQRCSYLGKAYLEGKFALEVEWV